MPTTTTSPPSGKALATLEKLDAKFNAEKSKADDLSRDHFSKVNRLRELHDERQSLTHNEPSLVDHRGAPSSKDNDVARVDGEIAKLGDLDDLGQRAAHQRSIADRAKLDATSFILGNLDAVLEGLRDPAEEIAASTNAAVREAQGGCDDYVAFIQRVMGILAAAGVNTKVPGLDPAAALSRQLRGWELPVPLVTDPGRR